MGPGIRAALGGIGYIIGTPSVWHWAAVPVLLLMILMCGLGGLGIWGSGWISGWLVGQPDGFWGHAGSWLLTIVLVLIAIALAVFVALAFTQPLSGFALEAIVRAQERALTGRMPPEISIGAAMFVSLKVSVVTIVLGVPSFVLLWVIGFAFPPATIVTIPLNFVLSAWLLAWTFLDYPLTLHGLGVRARMGWCLRHFGAFTMFGLTWSVLLLIPGLFFVILPMGVAGATRLVIDPEPWPGDLI